MRLRIRRFELFGLALGLLAPAELGAQEPLDRIAIRAFRDTLAVTTDTARLIDMEHRLIDRARADRDDANLHIRLGFLALRLADLGGSSHLDDAAGEFEWAASLQPGWPYPWLGLGLAESRMDDHASGFAGGLWAMVGADRGSRAAYAFAQSVRADATFVEGLVSFAQTAERQQVNAHLDDALHALRIATASPAGWHPALLLERGRVERMVGDPDSSRIALERALTVGADSAATELELARTLPLTADTLAPGPGPDTPVEQAYFAGAASDRPAIVAEYRDDLAPIAEDSTLAAFDTLAGTARVAWLRAFWAARDAADLRPGGARLAEHFRRWAYALAHFRLPPFRRRYHYGIELYQSGDGQLDDRGMVWIRQGAPTARIVWPHQRRVGTDTIADPTPLLLRSVAGDDGAPRNVAFQLPSRPGAETPATPRFSATAADTLDAWGNETWKYERADGDLILHFTASDDPQDYRLVGSVLNLDVGFDALLNRADQLPGLAKMLRAGPNTAPFLVQEERDRSRHDLEEATHTDSWERHYPIVLTGHAQWLPAGVRDGLPLVHVVYALDTEPLRADPSSATPARRASIHVRAAFFDSAGRPLAELDTVQRIRIPTTPRARVATLAELPVPAGTHSVRLGLEASSRVGVIYPLTQVSVPEVSGARADLSAVLIGRQRGSLPWVATRGDTAWIDAENVYSPNDTLVVHAEAYGVRPGTRYTVKLSLTRQRGFLGRLLSGSRDAITITEHPVFPGTIGDFHRLLDLGGLTPGSYRLELTLEGEGTSLVRYRELEIR